MQENGFKEETERTPKNNSVDDGLDFSHYFRWLFANFRECSLIS